MGPACFRRTALLATAAFLCAGQPANSQPKAGVSASGVFLGRSGKPMVKMRLILAEVAGDQELSFAKIKLAANPPTAITDDKGGFQFTGVAPGMYAVLYAPASGSKVLPAEISIKALAAVAQSPLPMLRDTQIGDTGPPNPDRTWGHTFTLLKGHTFYAMGANMKIWNATARWGPHGPFMEIRRGVIVQQQFPSSSPIKLDAWSY
ncbi:MAG TPA: hypothetical protein VEU11_05120 [Terriglobales bacterium]|nr:hypothetical protein [Terriglobales bacterium]